MSDNTNSKEQIKKTKKRLKGEVVSRGTDKTAVVLINRFFKHPKYGKYIRVSKKFKAHDPKNETKVGDRVCMEECRPVSKDKHFIIVKE